MIRGIIFPRQDGMGNPFSEALFRTCKYRLNWPTKGFAARADAQVRVKSVASWYKREHLHSRVRFVTPNESHTGQDSATLANRAILYANARAQDLESWSGKSRNWQTAGPVCLNPENEISAPEIRDAERNQRTSPLTKPEQRFVVWPTDLALV